MSLPHAYTVTAKDAVSRLHSDLHEHDPAERIQALRIALEHVQELIVSEVQAARRHGDSWGTIGTALDMSRQAAWERFADQEADRSEATGRVE